MGAADLPTPSGDRQRGRGGFRSRVRLGGSSVATRIGVDLGGTKIEAIVMDEHSRLVVRECMATPQSDAIKKRPKLLDTREP